MMILSLGKGAWDVDNEIIEPGKIQITTSRFGTKCRQLLVTN
jgi:hypothetical protein